ncbi:ciliary microtubule inner protein 2C [Colius striatus]|uniref:ciliary microtubule inner protein 2C n=1 Tax=Colius striatus TaxID=57412 RepID=UPI002B1E8145|nr:ciliary microtubule inner protein 2C [Colius striatus]
MRYPQGPQTMKTYGAEGWDSCSRAPLRTRFNLDNGRSQELSRFYQLTQQHREFYRDRSGMLYLSPYFDLPSKEKETYPHPLDLPPLSLKTRWHLLRVSPLNLRTYQTFPSGKRVTARERKNRDSFFENRS